MTPTRDTHEQFVELILPLMAGLLRFCRALTDDRDTAKDLASETVLIAFEQFDNVREKAAIQSYLYTTASRLARTERNKVKRHVPIDDALREQLHDHSASPETLADIRTLQSAMNTLPEKMREAVMCFEIAGLSLAEIQAIQGGSLSAVKMRIVRGRKLLAKKLGVREMNMSEAQMDAAIIRRSNQTIGTLSV